MAADSRLEIFKSHMLGDRYCSNYLCQDFSREIYHVANPHGVYYATEVYCPACARHLAANIPPELLPKGNEIEARIRADLEKEFEAKLNKMGLEFENAKKRLEESAKMQEIVETETVMEVLPFVDEVEEEEETKPLYRCLECNAEFDTPQKLGTHKRKHQ